MSTEADNYLLGRGVLPSIRETFRLGYCPSAQVVYDSLVARYQDLSVFETIGFWKSMDDGVNVKFADRIMFPYVGLQDEIHGFGGRFFLPDDDRPSKYVNTNNCPTFNKSLAVYGLAQALAANPKIDEWILVEGNLDVVMLHQAGFTNAVCAGGTSLTDWHAMLLSCFCKNFLLMFDSDDAGRIATTKSTVLLSELEFGVRRAELDGYKDAAEALQNDDPQTIIRAIENAK
jgi:DNA primase